MNETPVSPAPQSGRDHTRAVTIAITLIGLPSLGALGSGYLAQALGGLQGARRAE